MARTQGSRSETTRPLIMEAAKRLIARHGFAAVSMRQIAAETGKQVGALYSYIPDKQALLFELMRSHMMDLLQAASQLDLKTDPGTALESFTRFHIDFHLARPEDVFVAYMELRNLEPDNFKAITSLRHEYEDVLRGILIKGTNSGAFQLADVRVSTRAVIAMLTGVTTWYRDHGILDRDEVIAIYWRMVAGSVGYKPA